MINIAELLKDVAKHTELYSPICGRCKLSGILYDDGIRVIAHDVPFRFDKYGRFCSADDAECLLFPSEDCRTWEGWKPPLKAGDVVMFVANNKLYLIGNNGKTFDVTGKENKSICGSCKRVTLEEEQNFFVQLCLNGYTWDSEKKELKKIPKHYDISNFKAGMPVLVRDRNENEWCHSWYSHYCKSGICHFNAVGLYWKQCIPFEGNEHLLGTTDMPSEEFINW